jgi:hypothetical protein
MKRALFCIVTLNVLSVKPIEKPFESSYAVNFFIPYKENPLVRAQIPIRIIDANRVIALPAIYQTHLPQIKCLLDRLFNPYKQDGEGSFNAALQAQCSSPFDIVALKKITAYFPADSIIAPVSPACKIQDEDSSFYNKFTHLFISSKKNTITFCAPDREKNQIHEFEIDLPSEQRFIELAPISNEHIALMKVQLNNLMNIGIGDSVLPMPLRVLHVIAQLQ